MQINFPEGKEESSLGGQAKDFLKCSVNCIDKRKLGRRESLWEEKSFETQAIGLGWKKKGIKNSLQFPWGVIELGLL